MKKIKHLERLGIDLNERRHRVEKIELMISSPDIYTYLAEAEIERLKSLGFTISDLYYSELQHWLDNPDNSYGVERGVAFQYLLDVNYKITEGVRY